MPMSPVEEELHALLWEHRQRGVTLADVTAELALSHVEAEVLLDREEHERRTVTSVLVDGPDGHYWVYRTRRHVPPHRSLKQLRRARHEALERERERRERRRRALIGLLARVLGQGRATWAAMFLLTLATLAWLAYVTAAMLGPSGPH